MRTRHSPGLRPQDGDNAAGLVLVILDTPDSAACSTAPDGRTISATCRHCTDRENSRLSTRSTGTAKLVQAGCELAAGAKHGRAVRHRRRHQRAGVGHLRWVEEEELPTRAFSDPEVRRIGPAVAGPARARPGLLVLRRPVHGRQGGHGQNADTATAAGPGHMAGQALTPSGRISTAPSVMPGIFSAHAIA